MSVCFWNLVKNDLSSVHMYSKYNGDITFYRVLEKHGHVYLVGLYHSPHKLVNKLVMIGGGL